MAEPSGESARSALRRQPGFLLLVGGRAGSALGSAISGVAFPLLILALTGSPALAGVAGGLRALPSAVLNLPAGVLVDRWNLKAVMIASDAVRALVLGSIPLAWWLRRLSLPQLYVAAAVEGTLYVFYNTAWLSSLPRLVPRAQLASASAQFEGSYYGVSLVGPSLGGILYQAGQAFPFLADALSYLLSVVSLLPLEMRPRQEDQPSSSFLQEARDGVSWIWHMTLIRSIALLEAGEVVIFSAVSLLVIVLAREQHASAAATGLALSIGAVGGIVGAASARVLSGRGRFGWVIIGVQWVRAALFPLYAVAPNPIALGLVTAGIFFLNPVRNATLFAHVVPLIPEELRGRILALWDLAPSVAGLAGAPLVGLSLQAAGPRATILAGTALGLLLALIASANASIRSAASFDLHRAVHT